MSGPGPGPLRWPPRSDGQRSIAEMAIACAERGYTHMAITDHTEGLSIALLEACASGLPIGVQLMGNYLQEGRLLNLAHQFQQVTDFHTRKPQGY